MTQHTDPDPKSTFRKAMSVIRQTGTRFKGTGLQKVREIGFVNPATDAARKPRLAKAWDPRYFEVLANQVGKQTAARLIHAGVVHQ